MSEDHDIVVMTGNFTCENTISEFLLFSTFRPNWFHVKTTLVCLMFDVSVTDMTMSLMLACLSVDECHVDRVSEI